MAAFNAQSNLVSELRQAVVQFPREKALRIFQLQSDATPLDPAHADVRPEDIEIMRLDDIETGLNESLGRSEQTLTVLSNLVRATSVRQTIERTRIVSMDAERGSAQLEDGLERSFGQRLIDRRFIRSIDGRLHCIDSHC